MEFHELANLFPLMEGVAFDELVADIKANGLREPVITHEGQILDGRNRFRACQAAGVEPRFEQWGGKGSPIDFVVSKNLRRRHLDTSQRAMVAARIANLRLGENQYTVGRSKETPTIPVTTQGAADTMNVSEATVKRARGVLAQAEPELVEAVERGDVTVGAAYEARNAPKSKQRDVAKNSVAKKPLKGPSNNTRRPKKRNVPEVVRTVVPRLASLAQGLAEIAVHDAEPTADDAAYWEKELALAVSARQPGVSEPTKTPRPWWGAASGQLTGARSWSA